MHRIARVGVRPLVGTPITPNHLTTLRLAAGIGAAAAFAVGSPPWPEAGAAIFAVAMLLDRADGELARLSGRTSRWGHVYDLFADTASNALAFVGVGFGLARSLGVLWPISLGILAGAAVAAMLWLVMRFESRAGERAGEFKGRAGFDPDDAMIVVPIAVALGGAAPLLIAAGLGAPAFALYMFLRFRRRLAPGRLI